MRYTLKEKTYSKNMLKPFKTSYHVKPWQYKKCIVIALKTGIRMLYLNLEKFIYL